MEINGRRVGLGSPAYIIAEMSANHHKQFDEAVRIIEAAKAAGADAIKLQTYTPDTLTIPCDNEYFKIKGTLWDGRTLHELYDEAQTPWEWHPKLQAVAEKLGLDFFSTPFDVTSVDFLESLDVPAYKIASFELINLPLLRRVAQTGKPVILSTGMATLEEIREGVQTLRSGGSEQIALLRCASAYPAPPEEMQLRTIPALQREFGVPIGLSDHTLGISVPVAAVALGACLVEKHLTRSRNVAGPDSGFSSEPSEFRDMVDAIRAAEAALGEGRFGPTAREQESIVFRRSLFIVEDIKAGEVLTARHVRAIRPGHGLHPRHLQEIIGRHAVRDVPRGTPVQWDLLTQREGSAVCESSP